jgi:Protein O-mannosyl-transferase TMEM260-like
MNPRVLKILIVVLSMVLYVRTMLPGVGYSADTAKFQYVGYILGTPHPPGYPTYLLLNHVFTRVIPIGSIAYRANLLSAVFATGSILILFEILCLLEVSNSVAAITCLTFSVTRTFWSQAVIAEVYTLNVLFLTGVIYFLFRWMIIRKDSYLITACAIYAFSFGNHLTIITFLPAIFYLIWSTDRSVFFNKRLIFPIAGFIALGALQYLYPIWRYYNPNTLFLEMQTPDLRRLLGAVTGGHFKPRMFPFSIGTVLLERIPMFLSLLWKEYFLLIAVAAVGIWKTRSNKARLFLLLGILGNLAFSLNYDIRDIFVYFIPTYLILAVFIGIGFQALKHSIPQKFSNVVLLLMILVPVSLLFYNYSKVDQSGNVEMAIEAKAILEKMGRNAIFLAPGREFPRQFFFYYLFGENMCRNQLYVFPFSPKFINDYLGRKKPYYFREMRKTVPPGLDVYCRKQGHKNMLERKYGYALETVHANLYKVQRHD